jgi:hypothetical protein
MVTVTVMVMVLPLMPTDRGLLVHEATTEIPLILWWWWW